MPSTQGRVCRRKTCQDANARQWRGNSHRDARRNISRTELCSTQLQYSCRPVLDWSWSPLIPHNPQRRRCFFALGFFADGSLRSRKVTAKACLSFAFELGAPCDQKFCQRTVGRGRHGHGVETPLSHVPAGPLSLTEHLRTHLRPHAN
jgi:hypothetical protein